ncbi:DUF4142 domain-containing protein [Hymenobacter koreensis]|uniref:DUF4142 domain-containing protein n=1 Tax=Hymenobacter koreensis TaxID=1084523 RepID=A0ABP8IXM9_9BACT
MPFTGNSFMLYRIHLPWACLLLFVTSCGSGERDPVAEAKFQNEKRIGDANITERQEQDAEFIVNTASRGLLDVELAKLAQQRSTRPDLSALAQTLVRDHTGMHTALSTLAERKGLAIPQGLGSDQQDTFKELSALTGAEFEREYLEVTTEHHDDAADRFEDMAEDAYDGDIRAFAAKYAPVLKQHHEQAQQIQKALPKQ